MIENTVLSITTEKPKRPIGVWLLTGYALIFAGVLPLFGSLASLSRGLSAIIGVLMSIAIILCSVGTWQGKDLPRKLLQSLIILGYGTTAWISFLAISAGKVAPGEINHQWSLVIRGVLFIVIYVWYFNRSATKEFFQ